MNKRWLTVFMVLVMLMGMTVPAMAVDYTEVVPCQYDDVGYFSEGLAAVEKDGKWGYIDKMGKEVVPCIYDDVETFSDGVAFVREGIYWGLIDKTGKKVIPCKYLDAPWFTYCFCDGIAEVNEGGKWGFIDKTGKEVTPCQYDDAKYFSEGLAAVKRDGKWGYIDKSGREVVPCTYDYTQGFSEGLGAVEKDNKWGFIRIVVQVSDWAKAQVNRAAEAGLVPNGLGNDYRIQITRAQFAATTVKLYEAMSGQKVPAAGESPFSDTGDTAVIQAEAMGFVSGVGGGRFDPNALVTREQAAAMLSRVYIKLGGSIPAATAATFVDNGSVSAWARDAVAFMSDKGIVTGVGGNKFNPQGNASIEQALAIAVRMFENLR